MSITRGTNISAALLLAACCHLTPALADPLPCDDGIKSAFRPGADTKVVAVRLVKKGEELKAPDASQPVTAAGDLCLVKLLVGPGATAEKDKNARSYSDGIGIEVWLPTHANWNERIRNYGGGGWVGGGHRYADKIGSKVPAIVNANIGYASGTTDAGQPWYQDGSFAFLSDGKVNGESLRDFSVRAMVEQAVKTKALVNLYYGKAPKYAYYDGHSQGGRQGMKLVQEYPELYDGYMIAQPALSIAKFGTAGLYPQIVMKSELGFTAANKAEAAAFAAKVAAANKRAVAACDKPGLGFLLDPFACDYNPARDADTLCVGVADEGVIGRNSDPATCMNLKEANALNRIWYGATSDGSFDAAQSAEGPALPPGTQRSGEQRIGLQQLVPQPFQRRRKERQAQHDEKGELKARLKKLLRVPHQNNEGRRRQRIQQVARAFQRPVRDDHRHHDRRTDRGRLPAGDAGVRPDQRNDHPATGSPRHLHDAQQSHHDSGDQRDVQSADGEDVHRAGAHERFGDFARERRLPAECHRPQEPQILVFSRQSASQGLLRPRLESVGPAHRGGSLFHDGKLPIVAALSLQLVVDSLPAKVGAIIEESLRNRTFRRLENTRDVHGLPREEVCR
jgi:hypothetical protein